MLRSLLPSRVPKRQFTKRQFISRKLLTISTLDTYKKFHEKTMNPSFWGDVADELVWFKKYSSILDSSKAPFHRWFKDGQINTCFNALDRHVIMGYGNDVSMIYDSPMTGTVRNITYAEMLREVSRLAGVLKKLGVGKGDTVVIYMPMIPEAIASMLACSRIGAVHAVIFGGFASKELASRIDHCKPKVVISASCGLEPSHVVEYEPLLEGALKLAEWKPSSILFAQREQHRASLPETLVGVKTVDYHDALEVSSETPCVALESTDPLYLMYTSGTTGAPKAVVRDNGGHAVAIPYALRTVFGVNPGDTWMAASDIGWVVGHSYIVYGPMISRVKTVLYEGKPVGTPDAGAYWRMVDQHKINGIFTAPTAVRAIKKEDPELTHLKKYNIGSLRSVNIAGERADPDTIQWLLDSLKGIHINDNYWQTETGWPICSNVLGVAPLPVKPGSASVPVWGYDMRVLDAEAKELPPCQLGELALKLPLPPGTLTSLYKNDQLCEEKYYSSFPGYYQTGDAGWLDQDGYVHVMTRVDDIINVAGHRLSTGALEEVVARHTSVAECAVIGVYDAIKGEVPLGLIVLKSGISDEATSRVVPEVIQSVRDTVGPVASFKKALIVKVLPKTRSGKILRKTINAIAHDTEYKMPATIDDPASLDHIKQRLTEEHLIHKPM